MAVRVPVRNINKSLLYDGPMDVAFRSSVGDLKEMALGYIQAIYTGNDATDGTFELFVAASFCGNDDHFARYPGGLLSMDASCGSIGWNIICAGYRFFQIRYTPNSVTTGDCEIIAIAKKGG